MNRYRKFVAAVVGATLAVLNVFVLDAGLSERAHHWISTAIAVVTALSVYMIPNDPPA